MRTIKLRDIASPISINISNPSDCGYDKFVGLEHYDSGEFVISRYSGVKLLTSAAKEFKKNDILIARRNVYLKRAGIVKFDGITSGDSIILRVNEHTVDTVGVPREIIEDYLPLVLNTEDFWLYANKHADGMNSKRISKDTLLDYEFMLPSEIEIKTISEKAWAAYRLKEAYKRLLVATDEMVKSQFIELIRDCQTYLSISDLSLNFLKGITPTYVESSCVEVINQACVTWDGIDFSNVKYQNSESSFAKGILNSDDLLLTMTGRGTLGRCNIFFPENDDITYIADSHISILRVNKTLVLPIIIAKFISLSDTQDEIYRNYVTGSTNQLDIVFSKIKNFKIPVPPMALQEEFAAIVSQADKSKFELKKAIEAIDQVIKSLING